MNSFGRIAARAFLRVRAVHGLVLTLLLASAGGAQGQTPAGALRLDDAVLKALQHNPQLQVFDLRLRALKGASATAGLRPAYALEAEVEGFAGSGELTGLDSAEQTVALSSVIELGGKRAARLAAVSARASRVVAEREAEALALLGEVTQRFVEALATQRRLELARDAVTLARTTLQTVQKRAEAGAAPAAEVLRAQAALEQARLAEAELERAFATERLQLAVLWGATQADFSQVQGELFQFPPADDFSALFARAENSAALAVLASEARLREAELRLARTQTRADIDWRLGVRRIEPSGDNGLVASVSVPLFSGRRGRGDIIAAEAARDEVQVQTDAARLELRARLFEAYQNRAQSVEAATALHQNVVPTLERALRETRSAFERGRYSYLDLIGAQRELLEARERAIEAAAAALGYGALIEQLTAEPLQASPTAQP